MGADHRQGSTEAGTDRPAPRVLVIRGGAIGDFILTLPAIRLLREELPLRPQLEILGYKPIIELAEAAGLADATRSIEHRALASFFIPNSTLDPEWVDFFAGFNVVVSYLYDPDGIFRANVERCRVRTYIECSHRVDESSGIPAALQLAKPLEMLALFLEDPAPVLDLKKEAGSLGRSATAPVVALHPGSGSPRKNWGYENWVRVAAAIRVRHQGARLLVVSGEAEQGTIGDLLELLRRKEVPFDHLHGAPLPEVGCTLSEVDLFLGHDSGISHLAAAVGAPCLLLFGPTPASVWAPQNPKVRALESDDRSLASIDPRRVAADAVALLEIRNTD